MSDQINGGGHSVPNPDPIPITDVFVETFKRLLESHGDADPNQVGETVALEYGIPFESLLEAVKEQIPGAVFFTAMTSPTSAMAAVMLSTFIAGVAWEQGRSAD